MSHTRLWAATAIILFAVIIGFALSVPHTRDVAKTPASQSTTTSTPIVSLHDTFKKGVHTITGFINAPDACATATARATFTDANGIHIAISMPEDSGVCLQLPTRIDFSVTVSAPARVPLSATVNGSVATTTTS